MWRAVGDLSGGQAIARSLRKGYSLPESGEGSSFYEFFLPASSQFSTAAAAATKDGLPQRATLAETKLIKEWFRAGLDTAGNNMNEEQRLRVLAEAKEAFKLNMRVSVLSS